MSTQQVAGWTLGLYRKLAEAFPEEFRRAHAAEMVQVTEDLVADVAARASGWGFVPMALRLLWDLLVRVVAEHWVELGQDAAYGTRMLRRSPGFTAVAVFSLGVGIGMCVSIYSQLEGMIYRPVPGVSAPRELVRVLKPVSFPNYEHFRDHSGQFAEAAAYVGPVPFVVRYGPDSQRIWGHLATPNYFQVLGVKPRIGRLFDGDGVVISNRLWKTRFEGMPDAIGKMIQVNGKLLPVTGVAPEGFLGASPMTSAADVWLPTTAQTDVARELGAKALSDRNVAAFQVFGRLAAGRDMGKAEAALEAQVRQLEQTHGDPGKDSKEKRVRLAPGGRIIPIRDEELPLVSGFPVVLGGLMLWIACATTGTMLTAKAVARRKEIAVRLALGASRYRMIRQLLTESMLLAALGGLAGFLFAAWSNSMQEMLRPILPNYIHFELEVGWAAAGATVVITMVAGLMFGLTPALLATRAEVAPALKAGASTRLGAYRWFSARNLLVLQQVAASLALLLITGFMVMGFNRVTRVDPGYEARDLYLMSVDPVREGYPAEKVPALLETLRDRLEQTSGIQHVTLAQSTPLAAFSKGAVEARLDFRGERTLATAVRTEIVGKGFFETVGIPILRGRGFVDSDFRSGRAAIINETMATRIWKGEDPIGRQLELNGKMYEVAGVSRDVRNASILQLARNGVFLPAHSEGYATPGAEGVTLIVRSEPGVDAIRAARDVLRKLDANLVLFNARSMTEEIRQMMYLLEVTTIFYGAIGMFGLLLSAVGLSGVTAYAVTQRTKEIGIRMALGARRLDVLGLVMREGVWLVVVGTALGFAGAFAILRGLKRFLGTLSEMTEQSTSDPMLLWGSALLLAGLALLACYWPARRSTRIDPTLALREE